VLGESGKENVQANMGRGPGKKRAAAGEPEKESQHVKTVALLKKVHALASHRMERQTLTKNCGSATSMKRVCRRSADGREPAVG
jgi:hypothetical protein